MQEILDAYRDGDMSTRTNLFLTYRELREEFMAIEEGDCHELHYLSCKGERRKTLLRKFCVCLKILGIRL